MAADLKLSMSCGPYDRAQALFDGRVKPEGIELSITVNDDDVDRQQRAARGELHRPKVLRAETDRMLADPRAKKALVESFASQWLNLRQVVDVVALIGQDAAFAVEIADRRLAGDDVF